MRKGLLVYIARGRKKNMGDYVQSIAAEQYTGRDVVFLNREHLDKYSGEPIKLIMNSWFMEIPENWPPSPDILPLFTSVHINQAKGEKMLSNKGITYFKEYVKKYGPIGTRDKGTERLLKSKGIDAYFSGCLTLTLGKTYRHNPESRHIRFVDPHYETSRNPLALLGYLFTIISHRKTILKISSKLKNSISLKNLLKTSSFYQAYCKVFEKELLENADYITHMVLEASFANEESKFEYTRDLLNKYADSQLVVTSRIHAALPCNAMETPVIFIVSDDLQPNGKGLQPLAKGRLDGLLELFNVMEYLNFKLKPILGFKLDKKIGLNHSIRNKQNHLKLAEELDKNCTSFINNAN